MVKVGDKIKSISINEIQAFYSLDKATYLFTNKRSYPIDYALDDLMEIIDSEYYFKVNRKYIVSIDVCTRIIAWSNSRLKLTIEGIDDDVIVAREKVQEFKQWLDR